MHSPQQQSSPFCNNSDAAYDVVALAASVGGLKAFCSILAGLPASFPAAVLVAQHRSASFPDLLPGLLRCWTKLAVKQAEDGEALRAGTAFVCPADRHLLIEPGGTLGVRQSDRVRFYRPSVDLLFESVANGLGNRAIAVVLTGMGDDGSRGVRAVRSQGGFIIAQDEGSSQHFSMPLAAIATEKVDLVLPLSRVGFALTMLVMGVEAGLAAG